MNYIIFLRAVNVGGRNKIKMKELTDILIKSGFSNVRSHIQSGNILLSSVDHYQKNELENKISELIKDKFNLDISVLSFEFDEYRKNVEEVLSNHQEKFDYTFITYLKENPDEKTLNELKEKYLLENYYFSDRFIIGFAPDGYSKVKFNNSFFEKKLKLEATTRNLKVSTKLIELGNEMF